jgi:chemosensory pili system protein ChpA (sensor histidine kinase/response regulator)
MSSVVPVPSSTDLSALAWVHDELRRTLEAAHKALRRFLKEVEAARESDLGAADPSVLRQARAQVHQGVGALELVRLPSAAQMLRASEAAIARIQQKPQLLNAAAAATIEQGSFALLEYLSRMLARKPVSALLLFPQYRAIQQLAASDRIHPADLWQREWQWGVTPTDTTAPARQPDAKARSEMEALMLSMLREPSRSVMLGMSELCAGLGCTAEGLMAESWKLAAGFFQAQGLGLLQADLYAKRIASRLLMQLRLAQSGQEDVSERLAKDLLFFCAHAQLPQSAAQAPRWAAVRSAYGLDSTAIVDYETPRLGKYDPAWLAQGRKRVAAAKEAWSTVAAGERGRLHELPEQFSLVGESVTKLFPNSEALAKALLEATFRAGKELPTPLAMEVATSLLYLEASLDDAEFDHPDGPLRLQRMAQRIQEAVAGHPAQGMEPWMEELYRRVSDRQTMGSVVQELRASLGEVETQIDRYFRDTRQRELLIPVPGQLKAMRGVLSVLNMDQASQAVQRMSEDVDALCSTDVQPELDAPRTLFDRLADNLSALSFLIDMLNVQPHLAKALFRFDADSGRLSTVMAMAERATGFGELMPAPSQQADAGLLDRAQELAVEAARGDVTHETLTRDLERMSQHATLSDQPALAQTMDSVRAALEHAADETQRREVRAGLAQVMQDFADSRHSAMPGETAAEAEAPLSETPLPEPEQMDDEMREIFIEEAREVVQGAQQALGRLHKQNDDLSDLTSIRRAFHTLKGSSRMVGLNEVGDAGWACEQLYNAHLAQSATLTPMLADFTGPALEYFEGWVEALAARQDAGHRAAGLVAAADALRLQGQFQPIEEPCVAPAAAVVVAAPITAAAAPMAAFNAAPAAMESQEHESVPIDFVLDFNLPATTESAALPVAAAALGLAAGLATLNAEQAAPVALEVGEASFSEADDAMALFDSAVAADPLAATPPAARAMAEATAPGSTPEAVAPPEPEALADNIKVIGSLRISIPLFNIYLNEADELSRRLCTELSEWALQLERPLPEATVALAHSLAGSSATVGYAELSSLARALEHALGETHRVGYGSAVAAGLFNESADEIRRLLHQFAAGFLHPAPEPLLQRLQAHELAAAREASQEVPSAFDPLPFGNSLASELDIALDDEPVAQPALALGSAAMAAAAAAVVAAPAVEMLLGAATDAFEPKMLAALPARDERPVAHIETDHQQDDNDIDAQDAIDAELFPVFSEEAEELLPLLHAHVRDWARAPASLAPVNACMRNLHTFKGGARLAGAMRLGEMAHRMETTLETVLARGSAAGSDIDDAAHRADALQATLEALQQRHLERAGDEVPAARSGLIAAATTPLAVAPLATAAPIQLASVSVLAVAAAAATSAAAAGSGQQGVGIDWAAYGAAPVSSAPVTAAAPRDTAAAQAMAAVRVRAPLLDRLVNHAGEVSIARARIDTQVQTMRSALDDLSENLSRLRAQLRDLEVQAESQISSRMEAAKASTEGFDPLEMDRFTRLQELTRMMAESVSDVATVQRGLERGLHATEDDLAAQARLSRELQEDLLRTRMVEFEGLADRLYRVVRQAAKETGKQVRLDLIGGNIEVDRGVLDRVIGPLEHLLRNAVVHGIEQAAVRQAAGKDVIGTITLSVRQEGNEVDVECRDDGGGLDLTRIRERALEMGLVQPNDEVNSQRLANFIFTAGFSTVRDVNELAGRGVGMDVVRAEITALGGRIETASAAHEGSSFRLVLPLTTAVTQVVMLRSGSLNVAVPSTLVELVQRVPADVVRKAYATGVLEANGATLPFYWMGGLLQESAAGQLEARMQSVLIMRSAAQRLALHVDEVLGNQEVVVKALGPQLARLPGLAGVTLLPSGQSLLIYNPVALAALYGQNAQGQQAVALGGSAVPITPVVAPAVIPLVLVVDDSLTVRRVTQRLLQREGYRVTLAKDGLDALEKLAEERPTVVLCDIEMPRMDGFDLLRNLRAEGTFVDLPMIMITSRLAQKHRDHALELGANHYLGKPYAEDELLSLVGHYAKVAVALN